MFLCQIIKFFFNIFPLKTWQAYLIRSHIEKCTKCQSELANAEEVKPLLFRGSEVGEETGLWTTVKAQLREEKRKERLFLRPRWQWGFATAVLFAVIMVSVWLNVIPMLSIGPSEELGSGSFQIHYLRVDGEPAQAFLYQPQGSDMIFVWAEKNL